MIYRSDDRHQLCHREADKLQPRYELRHCFKTCFLVSCKHLYDLGMLFVRSVEFTESINKEIKDSSFYLTSFMDYYRDGPECAFTYPAEIDGYNVNGAKVRQALYSAPDFNPYDQLMLRILNKCEDFAPTDQICLIGALLHDEETIEHELAHALWMLDSNYQQAQRENIKKISLEHQLIMKSVLEDWGYHPEVHEDEMHAYMVGELPNEMQYPDLLTQAAIRSEFTRGITAQGFRLSQISRRANLLRATPCLTLINL